MAKAPVIYVDDAKNRFHNMVMSHLFVIPHHCKSALDRFATRLGLSLLDKHNQHYDVSQSKRKLAIRLGAIPIGQKQGAKLRLEDYKND